VSAFLCGYPLLQGWSDYFAQGPNMNFIFLLRASIFQITDVIHEISAEQNILGPFFPFYFYF